MGDEEMYVNEAGSLLRILEAMDKANDMGRPDVVKTQIEILRNTLLNGLSNS